MKRYKGFLFPFFIFIFLSTNLFALTLRIDEGKIKKRVKPGDTISGVITITNPSEAVIGARAYLED